MAYSLKSILGHMSPTTLETKNLDKSLMQFSLFHPSDRYIKIPEIIERHKLYKSLKNSINRQDVMKLRYIFDLASDMVKYDCNIGM